MVELRQGVRDRMVEAESRSEGRTGWWQLRQEVRDRMVEAETRSEGQDGGN
jgi:hypothetical protein